MRHQNSVFHTVLKHVPWHVFDRLVDAHGADARVRRLSTRDQFIALLYGQLAVAQSLRDIEAGLASHAHRLYHLGARAISRSTLADANAKRPSEAFGALFAHLVAQAGRGLRRKIGEAVHLIDSTGLRLSDLSADWARFSDGVCGAKLHIVYDCDAERPIDAAITPPASTTSPPPRLCRLQRARPTSLTSAITTLPGGPGSTTPVVAS